MAGSGANTVDGQAGSIGSKWAVVTQREWRRSSRGRAYARRGALRAVVVHHTDIASAELGGARRLAEISYMRAIDELHLSRGWLGVGYHFVVMPSGTVFAGRPLEAMGAHVRGHNRGTVAISLAGDFNVERPMPRAVAAIDFIRRNLIPQGDRVPLLGHQDLADKACPGVYLYPYLAEMASAPRAQAVRFRGASGSLPLTWLPPQVAEPAPSEKSTAP